MSELIQIRKKSQLTLPASVRKELGLEEGDYIEVRVEDGNVILRPKKLIDKSQAWFWTRRWQEGEQAVDEDYRAGRFTEFPDAESAIQALNEAAEAYERENNAVEKKR